MEPEKKLSLKELKKRGREGLRSDKNHVNMQDFFVKETREDVLKLPQQCVF